MPLVLWVALGGGIGAAARYGVNVWSGRTFGSEFPWHTLIVNVLGCFLMGALTGLMALKLNLSPEVRAFLTTGILGGFTTFSAFSLDVALLLERKATLAAGAYAAGLGGLLHSRGLRGAPPHPHAGIMNEVKRHEVGEEEAGMRLDRWFKVHFPQVTFAYLNKLTRTGQVRVAGARAKTNTRLAAGQEIRVPPLAFDTRPADAPKEDVKPLSPQERRLFDSMLLHEDRDIFVLNKPSGLPCRAAARRTTTWTGCSWASVPNWGSARCWCTGWTGHLGRHRHRQAPRHRIGTWQAVCHEGREEDLLGCGQGRASRPGQDRGGTHQGQGAGG